MGNGLVPVARQGVVGCRYEKKTSIEATGSALGSAPMGDVEQGVQVKGQLLPREQAGKINVVGE